MVKLTLWLCTHIIALVVTFSDTSSLCAKETTDGPDGPNKPPYRSAQACLREFDRCDRGMYRNCCSGLICLIPPGAQQYQGYCVKPCPTGQKCP